MSVWPVKGTDIGHYKITSLSPMISQHFQVIERQTYSVLEWLGDVGGLFDMLGLIGGTIIGPLAAFSLKAELLT